VPHPLVAGKALCSNMNIHGLDEVANVLFESTNKELFKWIVERRKANQMHQSSRLSIL